MDEAEINQLTWKPFSIKRDGRVIEKITMDIELDGEKATIYEDSYIQEYMTAPEYARNVFAVQECVNKVCLPLYGRFAVK